MTHDHATAAQDPRAAEARRLREEEGLSLAQIRALIPVGKDRLQDWLKGTVPPEWTKRPRAKDDQRDAARELRRKGLSYNQIVAELGCSKSSVSLWVRDIEVVREVHPSWTPEARAKREVRRQERWEARAEERSERRAEASELYPEFSAHEVQFAGAIAYWCEGAKWKDWDLSPPMMQFINSDPALIRLFLRFVHGAPVSHGGLGYRLHLHERADEDAVKLFWMREIGLTSDDFSSTVWKRHNPKTVRKNVGEGYNGCLTVSVRKSRELYFYTDALVGAIFAGMAPPPPPKAWKVCGNILSASD